MHEKVRAYRLVLYVPFLCLLVPFCGDPPSPNPLPIPSAQLDLWPRKGTKMHKKWRAHEIREHQPVV